MFSLEKHLGEYTHGEILFGKVFKLNHGRWEKTLTEDEVSTKLIRAFHLTMVGIHACNQGAGLLDCS